MRRLNIRRVEVEDPERSVPFVFLSADGGRDAKSKDLISSFVFERALQSAPAGEKEKPGGRERTPGLKRRSTYLTFRKMMANV